MLVGQLFDKVEKTKTNDKNNKNGNALVSRRELFRAIFDIFDRNGDGKLSDAEVKAWFERYAHFFGRTLKSGWWENSILPLVKKIENGISQGELKTFLRKENTHIWDLRHWVIELTKPKVGKEDFHAYEKVKKK